MSEGISDLMLDIMILFGANHIGDVVGSIGRTMAQFRRQLGGTKQTTKNQLIIFNQLRQRDSQ
ncbi:MAG: twin-arginine translocase TatA/TatE family subunit [Bacteroidota bacterium]